MFNSEKYLFLQYKDTFTSNIKTGNSTSGLITAADDSPVFIPKTATETAIANSKLLLATVKESVVVFR